ncbi:MAG TPA: EscU/YscU/HrcU family type III secretion system export apparatus switch protein [Archangium sp.]
MSDSEDEEAKTEAPSERRLEQAFNEGDIALSHELVTLGAFLLGAIGLWISAGAFQTRLVRLVTEAVTVAPATPFGSLPSMIAPVALPMLGVLVSIAFGAVTLTFVQTKGHLWEDRATPDFTRVFSTGRLTRLFTKDFLVDLGIGLLKVTAVAWACWSVLKGEILTVNKLSLAAPGDALTGLFTGVWKIAIRAISLLGVFAAADFALTRYRYTKKHRMTKEEVKREMKEDEGDPMLRGARKRKHRELVKRNAVAETKKADVLLVNPTHIAIAIRYRKDEGGAPKVLAKGKGVLAETMRETARENGIPIVQDIPLARLLYKKVKIGGSVPAETYKAVAAVLAFVYRLTGRAGAMQK